MIITRSPLRITLGGGGTDLPSYYREHGGFLIAAAIDKYVYVTVHAPVRRRASILKYSKLEHVDAVDEVQHPIIREALRAARTSGRRSSRSPRWPTSPPAPASARPAASRPRCSRRCYAHRRRLLHPSELAELACDIEIDRLERADRQAGSVHRRVRRRHLLHVPARTAGRGAAAAARDRRRCSTSRTTCCCSSPATRAAPASILQRPEDAHRAGDDRRCSPTCTT